MKQRMATVIWTRRIATEMSFIGNPFNQRGANVLSQRRNAVIDVFLPLE